MTLSIKGLLETLSIKISITDKTLYIEYHYAENLNLFIVMLNVVMLNVVAPNIGQAAKTFPQANTSLF
jgi:hypothetical protein